MITQQVLDSSPAFHLRQAADESRAPSIIGEHWIDHLDAGVISQSVSLTTSNLKTSGFPCTPELESLDTCPV